MLFLCVIGLFVAQHGVLAATPSPLDAVGAGAGLPQTSLPILIAKIIRAVLGVLGIITVILVIYAGWLYMSAQGDPTKVAKSKKIITNAVIGLVIIFSSYSIASWILGKLLDAANGPGTIVSIAKKYSEPLAGSLGAGIIESHYPMRGATGVPRNTKVFVTFKEAIKPQTIIDGYVSPCTYVVANPQTPALCSTKLKTDAVAMFETAKGETTKLATDKVVVTVSDDKKTFVFKPVSYLGNAEKDTNFTVALKPSIQKADGSAAFAGVNSAGYGWNFTVSTTVDLTPPTIVSIIPSVSELQPPGGTVVNTLKKNISVEITFNEAMDPIATTGTYQKNGGATKSFQRITVGDGSPDPVNGSYDISNSYKTVGFTTVDACGKDPCGGTIYCLPGGKTITVTAKAASIDDSNPPQGILTGVNYDGVVDAAGNSLDGNGDNKACGSSTDKVACPGAQTNDDYTWNFHTSNDTDDTVPKIQSLAPDINEGSIDVSNDITLTFNTLLKASTISSSNITLTPDPATYIMWFSPSKTDIPNTLPTDIATQSVIHISHPPFISNAEGGSGYWPRVTQEVKSAYQICMFPSMGDVTSSAKDCNGADPAKPYCCSGSPSASACAVPLPK
ncbi:MAG: Ig-like domain-containing protein [Candidatus Uhrbacteria bacterium]|nr:Ig-like domain-containing protein [Candidatus Uhrbacteria bacterium]